MFNVKLKKDRDKSVLRKHPWIFSGAIQEVSPSVENGAVVEIRNNENKLIGFGTYSNTSQISVRVWSFDPDEKLDKELIKNRIEKAVDFRKRTIDKAVTNAYRLINSEGDLLPGLIVDIYNNVLVCQFLSTGAEYYKETILELLKSILNPIVIIERSDSDSRFKEGLEKKSGIVEGNLIDKYVHVLENDLKFLVDCKEGHKTGFYLDQRDNRKIVSEYSIDAEVLNCFSYTGGFSLFALKGGAKNVINVDSSENTLELLKLNTELNGFNLSKVQCIQADVFTQLRKFRDEGRQFDLIILDPPKFAESFTQVKKAGKAYKDINLLALKLLRENGILFTFSCSGHISRELFQNIISEAALDSKKNVRIIKTLTQSADHSVITSFPEGFYLKGFICEIY